jgi:hypothetical protein
MHTLEREIGGHQGFLPGRQPEHGTVIANTGEDACSVHRLTTNPGNQSFFCERHVETSYMCGWFSPEPAINGQFPRPHLLPTVGTGFAAAYPITVRPFGSLARPVSPDSKATVGLRETSNTVPLVTDFMGFASLTGGTQFVTLTKLSHNDLTKLKCRIQFGLQSDMVVGPDSALGRTRATQRTHPQKWERRLEPAWNSGLAQPRATLK